MADAPIVKVDMPSGPPPIVTACKATVYQGAQQVSCLNLNADIYADLTPEQKMEKMSCFLKELMQCWGDFCSINLPQEDGTFCVMSFNCIDKSCKILWEFCTEEDPKEETETETP